jgi:hypothetical protein
VILGVSVAIVVRCRNRVGAGGTWCKRGYSVLYQLIFFALIPGSRYQLIFSALIPGINVVSDFNAV